MAYSDFPSSSWFGKTLHDALSTSSDLLADGNSYQATLWTTSFVNPFNSETWDSDSSVGDYGAATGLWDGTDNGGSAESPIALTSPTLVASSGVLVFDSTNSNFAWSGLDEVCSGIMVHNSTDDVGVCVINFGEAKTVAGTLTFYPDVTYGLAAIAF